MGQWGDRTVAVTRRDENRGEHGGVVLRFLEPGVGQAPQLEGAHARWKSAGELLAVDEPIGLRIAAHQGGRKQHGLEA
jgi:hypothetical protein